MTSLSLPSIPVYRVASRHNTETMITKGFTAYSLFYHQTNRTEHFPPFLIGSDPCSSIGWVVESGHTSVSQLTNIGLLD